MHNPFYSASVFDAAVGLAARLPLGASRSIAGQIGRLAARACHHRFEIMRANLAVITGLSGSHLDQLTRRNFANFLSSLADYCHCHRASFQEIERLVGGLSGAEFFHAPQPGARGAILVTIHLGNWELGGIHAARFCGLPFAALTQREPDDRLHEWRANYRAHHGVKTITIGDDPFAFIEAVALLKAGGLVALLIDRPVAGSTQPVTMFGRTFLFSSGCELLARHSGARVIPVYVARCGSRLYHMRALAALEPDGAPAGTLTQALADAFAPVIREHAGEYYNYAPLLPAPITP